MQLQQHKQGLGARPSSMARQRVAPVQAIFGRKSSTAVVEKPVSKTTKGKTTSSKTTKLPERKESFISQTLNAFDFAEARSEKDKDLLWEAKYGERGPDGKMTPEQAAALRRKVGGTARDFWKGYVEEEQVKNIKPFYKPGEAAAVPFLPFLVATVVAMLAATVYVVSQTA